MKITSYRTYQPTAATRIGSLEKNAVNPAGAGADETKQNMDRIDISSSAMRAEIEKSARAITKQVTQPADVQRLDNLKKAVRDQSYYVPTERLVDAMKTWRTL